MLNIWSLLAKKRLEPKSKLTSMKAKDKVSGKVAAVLPFGVFVSLENGVEGLAHISELSWEKVEDPNTLFKVGDEVQALVLSVDEQSGRSNLSIKQLVGDPFADKIKDIQVEDVIKGKVTKITQNGVNVLLKESLEGMVPSAKLAGDEGYTEGEEYNFLVDSIDNRKKQVVIVKTAQEKPKDIYVAFALEVYGTIQENYWDKITDADLSNLFLLASQKVASTTTLTLTSANKEGVEKLILSATQGKTQEEKKDFVTNVADVVLANLKPFGRSRLYTQKEETILQNEVNNVDTSKNMYEVLEVSFFTSRFQKVFVDGAPKSGPSSSAKFSCSTVELGISFNPEN
jgi:ribosomal protein S1